MPDAARAEPVSPARPSEEDGGSRLIAEVRRALSTPGLKPEQSRAIVRLAEEAAHLLRRGRFDDERRRLADLVEAHARTIDELQAKADHRARALDGALWAAQAGMWECRLQDERLEWSAGVYELFGVPNGRRLHRRDTLDAYAPSSLEALEKVRGQALKAGGRFSLDAEITTAKGARRWIRLAGMVERENGKPIRLYGLKQDVTRERALADQARRLAEIDALTGLANRRLFDEQLADLARDPRSGLLLVDLDGFKPVNDTFGHAHGDACLQEAARRLESACRGAALIARLGGDEFAVLTSDVSAAERMSRRVVEALRITIERDGSIITLGASAGTARADGATPTEWFARADLALYAAKASGRGVFRAFEPSMAAAAMGLRLVG